MIKELSSVMWKEGKELIGLQGTRSGLLRLAIVIGVIGVLPAAQSGPKWIESPAILFLVSWLALFMTSTVVADAFAGERERHTLETLLATPLSDTAILFGKAGTAVIYGWGLALVCMLLTLITVNVGHGQGTLLLYPLPVAAGALVLSFLGAWLATGIGVIISLRASTVRQAYQTLSISLLLLILVPTFGARLLPAEWRDAVSAVLEGIDPGKALAVLVGLLLIVDVALLAAAKRRFQRSKLVLD